MKPSARCWREAAATAARRSPAVLGALLLILGTPGCARLRRGPDPVPLRLSRSDPMAGAPGARLPAAAPVNGPDAGAVYRLRVGDSVLVTVRAATSEQFDLVIDENGEIRLPLVEPIRAVGLTSTELENEIQRSYVDQKIYRYVTAHVMVPIRSYFVRGEVRAPGRYPLTGGQVTLLQVLATAGGYTEYANTRRIQIIRGNETLWVDAREFERHPERDIVIEPGDQVIVNRRVF